VGAGVPCQPEPQPAGPPGASGKPRIVCQWRSASCSSFSSSRRSSAFAGLLPLMTASIQGSNQSESGRAHSRRRDGPPQRPRCGRLRAARSTSSSIRLKAGRRWTTGRFRCLKTHWTDRGGARLGRRRKVSALYDVEQIEGARQIRRGRQSGNVCRGPVSMDQRACAGVGRERDGPCKWAGSC